MRMADGLKPCPFCGHEADVRIEHKAGVLSVGCPDCNIRTMYVKADDIGASEAIEMWNRRAERTCEMEWVDDWMGWHCKTCDNLRQGLPDQKPNYCPNCGARVEKVNE